QRGMKVQSIWRRLLAKPTLFLAQSDEDARRLIALGATSASVRACGNLKYDVHAPKQSRIAEQIRELAAGRPILVAGSTHGRMKNERLSEDEMIIRAWDSFSSSEAPELIPLLVLAPRHPQRFAEVEALVAEYSYLKATGLAGPPSTTSTDIGLLDTIAQL